MMPRRKDDRAKVVRREDKTESRISAAALYLFSTKGFEATGIRDIARDAGVTTAALYHYMGTKNDLLFRLVRDGMTRLISRAREALKNATSSAEKITALMTSHVLFHTHEPLLARVIDTQYRSLTEDRRAEVQALRDEYEALWAGVLLKGRDTLEFDVREPSLARLALLEMGNGVAQWYRPSGRLSAGQIAEEMSRLSLRLLGFQASGGARATLTAASAPSTDEALDDSLTVAPGTAS